MVGILLSYWEGLFSGAMLVSGSVIRVEMEMCPKFVAPKFITEFFWEFQGVILLMAEILHHLGCMKPSKKMG